KMKKNVKIISFFLAVVLLFGGLSVSAFAKEFAPTIDISNPGIQTQYMYDENDPSWVRKLVIKEDMLSSEGIFTEAVLHPVTDYPYTNDAKGFNSEVEEYIKTYTLDEDSQRAAYIYFLEQVGALSIISDPSASDKSKAEWLRNQGIIITEEEENDPDKVLMISALYAMMKNDLYYVYTGEHLTIPEGTPLEKAVVFYIASLSGNNSKLSQFIYKYFGTSSLGDLEDYIYYTSLMALYTNGYVSAAEIATLPREEVYRRVAIMTIRNYGLAIDSEKATTQELQEKYLTAMLGTQYRVSLDPDTLKKTANTHSVAYYILQRMAYEDAKLTISQKKYSYESCFRLVTQKTARFDLEKEFYSDIHEYNIYLESIRETISINPTALNSNSVLTINGTKISGGQYAKVALLNAEKQVINIVCKNTDNGVTKTSSYKINIFQGTTPPEDSDLTGIIPTYGPGDTTNPNQSAGGTYAEVTLTIPQLPYVSGVNGIATNLAGKLLSLNDKGQLVDEYGNVISQTTYETLPENYKYVLTDDGIIQTIFVGDTTDVSDTEDNEEIQKSESVRRILVIVSLVTCILLIIALITTLIITKKNRNKKSSGDKTRDRRAKEKAKKAKREAKAARKSNK
ncbi:MAG: cadherin-like beta sandwich domain-containing protein, partial [Clostridia bacterium]|nr:cadherin-like beta sandwich domain-containing protein [Clostridia bacterium]